jgi:hypothetical protein
VFVLAIGSGRESFFARFPDNRERKSFPGLIRDPGLWAGHCTGYPDPLAVRIIDSR